MCRLLKSNVNYLYIFALFFRDPCTFIFIDCFTFLFCFAVIFVRGMATSFWKFFTSREAKRLSEIAATIKNNFDTLWLKIFDIYDMSLIHFHIAFRATCIRRNNYTCNVYLSHCRFFSYENFKFSQ